MSEHSIAQGLDLVKQSMIPDIVGAVSDDVVHPEHDDGEQRFSSLYRLLRTAFDDDRIASMQAATALLASFPSLTAILVAPAARLVAVSGISVHAARVVADAGDLMRVALREEVRAKHQIGSFAALEGYLAATLSGLSHERLIALFLDIKNSLIVDVVLGDGTINHCQIYPRMIVEQALHHGAAAVILAHNHPSGDPTPSREDLEETRRIAAALATVDITFHDHVVVGQGKTISMRTLRAW